MPKVYSPDTHVLVTKGGFEEYLAKTTWENTPASPDGSRAGYFLVATTPPEVQEMKQNIEVKSKKEIVEKPMVDPVLTETTTVEPEPQKIVELKAKRGPKAKK